MNPTEQLSRKITSIATGQLAVVEYATARRLLLEDIAVALSPKVVDQCIALADAIEYLKPRGAQDFGQLASMRDEAPVRRAAGQKD